MKQQLKQLFRAGLLFIAFTASSYAFDGRTGSHDYDAYMCFALHYNTCADEVCRNSERRDCRRKVCTPLAAEKCRFKGERPSTIKSRFEQRQYRRYPTILAR